MTEDHVSASSRTSWFRQVIRALPPLPFLLVAGCAAAGAVEGSVRLGQTAYVGGPRVRVERVVEDSRCPVNTQCIWAGRLVVRATIVAGIRSTRADLTLGQPVPIADGKLMLVSALPDRTARDRANAKLPYRFTFDFQGGL